MERYLVPAIEDVDERFVFCKAIALAQAVAGDPGAAYKTLAVLNVPLVQLSGLQLIAGSQASAGDVDGVRKTLMTAEKIQLPQRRLALAAVENKAILAFAQIKAGDRTGAEKTLQEALRVVNSITDSDLRVAALFYIVETQTRAGDYAAARKTIEMIGYDEWGPYTKSSSYRAVARVQARHGDVQSTLAWISALPSAEDRAFALYGVADGILDNVYPGVSSP